MMWRSTALILLSFAAAGFTIWYAPALLDLLGLSEFAFVGQLCLVMLVSSLLEAAFRRLEAL
jgi:hypothetical protein